MDEEEIEPLDLTPDEWGREGWIALCEEHLDLYYEKGRDGYGEVCEKAKPLFCDHKGCEREAKWELYGDLQKTVEEVQEEGSEPYISLDEWLKEEDL